MPAERTPEELIAMYLAHLVLRWPRHAPHRHGVYRQLRPSQQRDLCSIAHRALEAARAVIADAGD